MILVRSASMVSMMPSTSRRPACRKARPALSCATYYAHHHGMSIAAVANVVFNGRLREWFHADPVIEAAELLLQEKAPRDIPIINTKKEPESLGKGQEDLLRPEVRVITNPLAKDRETVFLSNGHLRGHADGDRFGLLPLERPDRCPLEGRSDRGSFRYIHLPARYNDRRLVVGDRRGPAARKAKRRRPVSATTRPSSSRRSAISPAKSNALSPPSTMPKAAG